MRLTNGTSAEADLRRTVGPVRHAANSPTTSCGDFQHSAYPISSYSRITDRAWWQVLKMLGVQLSGHETRQSTCFLTFTCTAKISIILAVPSHAAHTRSIVSIASQITFLFGDHLLEIVVLLTFSHSISMELLLIIIHLTSFCPIPSDRMTKQRGISSTVCAKLC